MSFDEMIQRAREFADLARRATQGPWVSDGVYVYADGIESESFMVADCDQEYSTLPADADLIAAAPEMAALLAKMADALEDLLKKMEQ